MTTERRAVIFDFNRTLYDPLSGALYPGVRDMLDDLKKTYRLILWSRREGDRGELVRRLGIYGHFEGHYFVSQKSAKNLREILDAHELTPQMSIVVGDLVENELRAAGELDIQSIWTTHGIFANERDPRGFTPTFATRTISELHELLSMLE